MQWRHLPQSKKSKSRQQRRAKFENTETAEVDHETENPRKPPALAMSKPSGVYFYHARRTKRLHIAIHAAHHYKKAQQAQDDFSTKQMKMGEQFCCRAR